MAQDNGAAIIVLLKTALETIPEIGVIYDHEPIFRTVIELDSNVLVPVAGKLVRKFWSLRHHIEVEPMTYGSDQYTHKLELHGWLPCQLDVDFGKASRAAARADVALVMDKLNLDSILSPGITYCSYGENRPTEEGPMEIRKLLGYHFYIPIITLGAREEIVR
jgi:hypothetical protein